MTAPVPSSGLSPERLEEIATKINRAHEMVSALCHGKRDWIMSIPAQPDRDPDIVISDGLHGGDDLLAEVRRLQGELAAAREETARFRKALAGDDPEMPEGLWPIETIAAAVDYAEDEHAWKAEHSTVRADEDPDATWECIRDAIAVVRELRSIVRSRSLPEETADA